jgi:cytochrome c553
MTKATPARRRSLFCAAMLPVAALAALALPGGISIRSLAEESPADEVEKDHPSAGVPRFETHIAPIFRAHCVRCHNADAMKAELDLGSPQGVFKESGAIVTPGKLGESLLWDMVHEGLMPPEGEAEKPLSAAERTTIREWIEAGAPLVAKTTPEELASAGEVSNLEIEPLMLLRCGTCHGLREQQAGLDLRTKASMPCKLRLELRIEGEVADTAKVEAEFLDKDTLRIKVEEEDQVIILRRVRAKQ